MNLLLVFAFVFAFGNAAYALGANDIPSAIIASLLTAGIIAVGIVGSKENA